VLLSKGRAFEHVAQMWNRVIEKEPFKFKELKDVFIEEVEQFS
jgi:hypothetical protein